MRRFNYKNRKFILKIFSFFASIFIWLYVISTAEVEMDKSVAIDIVVPDKYALAENIPDSIQMTLKGPRVLVRQFVDEKKALKLEIDPKENRGKFSKTFKVNQYMKKLPLGIELLSFSPKKITLKLERKLEKSVPVVANVSEFEKLPWFSRKKLEITPNKIVISGPRGQVRKIRELKTLKISTNDILSGKPIKVSFDGPEKSVKLNKKFAVVSYHISGQASEFTFSKIPIIFQSAKIIKSVYPRTVKLVLKGDKSKLEKFNTELIQVIAPIQKSTRGNAKVELYVELPNGVELVKIEPKFVDVIMEN